MTDRTTQFNQIIPALDPTGETHDVTTEMRRAFSVVTIMLGEDNRKMSDVFRAGLDSVTGKNSQLVAIRQENDGLKQQLETATKDLTISKGNLVAAQEEITRLKAKKEKAESSPSNIPGYVLPAVAAVPATIDFLMNHAPFLGSACAALTTGALSYGIGLFVTKNDWKKDSDTVGLCKGIGALVAGAYVATNVFFSGNVIPLFPYDYTNAFKQHFYVTPNEDRMIELVKKEVDFSQSLSAIIDSQTIVEIKENTSHEKYHDYEPLIHIMRLPLSGGKALVLDYKLTDFNQPLATTNENGTTPARPICFKVNYDWPAHAPIGDKDYTATGSFLACVNPIQPPKAAP